jgi:quercetin dioxygenase-like cupin family protein
MPALPARISVSLVLIVACGSLSAEETEKSQNYEYASVGTRQFESGPEADPLRLKVLVEEANLGSPGAEIIEIYFPPGYESRSHFHELEILYVLEGELEHIVDGVSNTLKPGMVGIVRFPNQVIHKAHPEDGARVLVIWPLGNEVKGFDGMTEKPIE